MSQTRPFFSSYFNTMTNKIWLQVDDVLGIRTQDRSMVGADESTEL